MSDYAYLICPFAAWLLAGVLKFIINSLRAKTFAFHLIGYGGLPSNHSAIVSSMVALIALKEGFNHPAIGVAITLAFIVILDASSLRRQVGRQAAMLNQLAKTTGHKANLRERVGHSLIEIASGVLVGIVTAVMVHSI
jgi:acid phosphatase family membrane protein YuiD